jgi:hypothetical protein
MHRLFLLGFALALLPACKRSEPVSSGYGTEQSLPRVLPLMALLVVPENHAHSWVSTMGYLDFTSNEGSLCISSPETCHPAYTIRLSLGNRGLQKEASSANHQKVEVVGYFEYERSPELPFSRGTLIVISIRPLRSDLHIPGDTH